MDDLGTIVADSDNTFRQGSNPVIANGRGMALNAGVDLACQHSSDPMPALTAEEGLRL